MKGPTPIRNYALVGVASVAAATLAVVGVLALQPPTTLQAAHEPRTAAVGASEYKDERTVAVEVETLQPVAAALRRSGIVTSTACAAGGQLTGGKILAAIDARPILGLDTAVPFHRDIGPGSEGEDVDALRTRLASLGFGLAAKGRYSADLAAAIRKLQVDHGLSSQDAVLHLEDIAWLPAPNVRARTCEALLGSQYAAGTPFLTTVGVLQSARVVFPSGQPPTPGDRIVTFGKFSAPMAADGLVTERSFLDEISKSPEFAASQSSSSPKPLSVKSALSTPLIVAKVPLSGLFSIKGNTACVKASDGTIHRATIAGSSLGAVLASFPGEAPKEVLLGDAAGRPEC
ncbi:peptidoglycan-binding protein [bacterium RCC_150]